MSPSSPDDPTQIQIVFDYTIQKVPTRARRSLAFRHLTIHVLMQLKRRDLRHDGTPTPRALWFAEKKFRERYYETHLPDVRLIEWKSHLADSKQILSEYRIFLPASES
jgi:hypothetical protein